MERYFTDLATAFVRGRLGNPAAMIEDGLAAGLRLHKFKQNTELPTSHLLHTNSLAKQRARLLKDWLRVWLGMLRMELHDELEQSNVLSVSQR